MSSKKKKRRKNTPFLPEKSSKKETIVVENKHNEHTSNKKMELLITFFHKHDQKILKNALLCCKGDVALATNYILDTDHQTNDKELDAAQGMLHFSTTA